jgi:hypothetical protein
MERRVKLSPSRRLHTPTSAMQAWQTCRTPGVRIGIPIGLRLAALAAVLACARAAPVLLQPQAVGDRDVPILPRAGVELNPSPTLAGPAYRSRCSAVLRDSAVLRRSLSRCADSFAASEARAVSLALKFRASNRQVDRLVRENAELRARLEAVPGTVRFGAETIPAVSLQPAIAGSANGNLRTAAHTRERQRDPYPPLPASGTRPAHRDCVAPVAALHPHAPYATAGSYYCRALQLQGRSRQAVPSLARSLAKTRASSHRPARLTRTHTLKNAHTKAHARTHARTHAHARASTYTHACAHTYTRARAHACIRARSRPYSTWKRFILVLAVRASCAVASERVRRTRSAPTSDRSTDRCARGHVR